MTDNEKNNKSRSRNDDNNNTVRKSKNMILVDEKEPVGELPPPFAPRNIEVNEEDDMRDFYDLKKEIGRGRFGTVYLVEDKKTRQKFAAKFVNTKRNQDRANVEREVEIMKLLNAEKPHPRLIQLYDAYDMAKEMCLVLEIVDGGELFERVINDDFVLTERACTVFLKQICEGVEFIHSKNILHLDMKPENILCLTREGNRVKICDFGLARRYDPRKKLQVLFGTPEFVAPEVVNFEPIGFGTDMWSVGVICYVLLSGLSPFMGHNYVETMTNVTHNKYDFEDEAFDTVSDEAKEFIQKLLVLDKSLRLTPAQCLRHPWLRSPPPPQCCHLRRRFPSSASNSEDEASDEEDEDEDEGSEDEEEDDDDEEEEDTKPVIQVAVEEKIKKDEEETEKYSVRRRRRKEEEEEKKRQKEEELEEDVKRREMEEKRRDLERQIEEKKKRLEEEEERCRKKREEEEAKLREEEEARRRKREEEEARRKEEEENRRKMEEEEAKRKREEERRKREEEEARRQEEERARRRKREEEEEARRKKREEEEEEEEARRRKREEEEEARRRKREEEEEEARRRKREEEVRKEQESERRRKEEDERRAKEEERKTEEEGKRKEAEVKRRKEAEEKRRKEVEEKKRKEAEKRREEEEKNAKKVKQEEEAKKKKEAEDKKRKEGKERRRERGEGEGKGEGESVGGGVLARSKAQLREFVARWSAHPNSPYVVAAEDAPRCLAAARVCSGASLTSMAAQPPNDIHPDDLNDEGEDEAAAAGEDEEFVHYTISTPLKGPASPSDVTRSLEVRMKLLQEKEAKEDVKDTGKSGGKSGGKGSKRSGKRASPARSSRSRSRVLQESEEAEAIIQEILRVDHRSAYEEYQRMVGEASGSSGSGPLRRSKVESLQQEEGGPTCTRKSSSPSRQPRRQPSRDVPRDDRPPSREGERSPAPTHRRPSRDVPLNSAQMDRLAKAAGSSAAPQAWPDLIVAPQDEADEEVRQFSLDVPVASLLKSPSGTLRSVPGLKVSQDPEGDAAPDPIPTPAIKGAPSLTPPPSPSSGNSNKSALSPPSSPVLARKDIPAVTCSPSNGHIKPSLTPPPSPTPSQNNASPNEDAPSRLVAWILDIGTRTPPRQNSSSSLQDRVTQWEARDGSPRPSHSPSPRPSPSPSPRPSPSPSPSRRLSDRSLQQTEGGAEGSAATLRPQPPFNAISSENSSTEKVIQTPWGALKRSPSRSSFSKSPSREREASPVGPGNAGHLVQDTQVGTQVLAPRTSSPQRTAPARPQELGGWTAGGKCHTLPRSAKLMRQKSVGHVPAGDSTAQPEADGGLKRKSKFPPSPNKRPLAPLLFSAQDRISMFENQQPPSTRGPQKPLARTRSSVTLGSTSTTDPRAGDRSQVGFMKTRLLGRAGRGAGPAVPEEPSCPDSPMRPGPDAA